MKLCEIYNNVDVLWEGQLDGEDVAFVVRLEEGRAKAGFVKNTKGGVLGKYAKGALKFISNPIVAGMAAGFAIDGLKAYKRNKRMTTTFFAKDQADKRLYKKIVNDLMRTGNYKKKERYVNGGVLWELKRFN